MYESWRASDVWHRIGKLVRHRVRARAREEEEHHETDPRRAVQADVVEEVVLEVVVGLHLR